MGREIRRISLTSKKISPPPQPTTHRCLIDEMLFKTFALAALLAPAHAEYSAIAGYTPLNNVASQSVIDLDQQAIENYVMLYNFDIAQNIYDEGAHSESYALVNITTSGGLPAPVYAGQEVQALSLSGAPITGTSLQDFDAGSMYFRFLYDTDDSLDTVCHVGQLPEEIQAVDGCINDTGILEIDGVVPVKYAYDYQINNDNDQTIARLSLNAKKLMHDCATCPYPTYDKFYNYYGEFDYAHQWVSTAFEGNETDFKLGNGDFANYGDLGRAGESFRKVE